MSARIARLLVLLPAALLLWSTQSLACGGFFCSRTPVDQTAERIIFSVNDNNTTTAYVQISYAGDKDSFAWLVPVPSAPELDVFNGAAITALDIATEPNYFQEFPDNCQFPLFDAASASPMGGGVPKSGGGVTVIEEKIVGPFATVTLEGESAELIIDWLQENDFRITDTMVPYIQKYVDDKMKFVAMKLTSESDVSDIQPIKMTYQGTTPMVPIRLTTVAAQPEMGVVVMILGDKRFGPKNYVDLEIPDSLIEFEGLWGRHNYLPTVSKQVDKVGGLAFVTEYAQATSELIPAVENSITPTPEAEKAKAELLGLLKARPFITRLYTRMSAEEMGNPNSTDPIFSEASSTDPVSNQHPIKVDEKLCSEMSPERRPCDFTYCGRFGACVELVDDATMAKRAACLCAGGTTARATTTSAYQVDAYCEPLAFNFTAPAADSAAAPGVVFADSCSNYGCGANGKCVTMNGSPSCVCDPGFGALVNSTWDQTAQQQVSTIECAPMMQSTELQLPRLPAIGQLEGVAVTAGDPMVDALVGDPSEPVVPKTADAVGTPPSAGGAGSSGGCSVARTRSNAALGCLLLAAAAICLRRRTA